MASNALRFLDLSGEQIGTPITCTCDITDKSRGARQYVAYMLDRTNAMFEYKNLPDTLPAYMLELYLQIFGYCAVVDVKADWYSDAPSSNDRPGLHGFFGGIGGYRDIYYRPTTFIVANPRLRRSVNCTIAYDENPEITDDVCVLIKNDTNYNGLLPLFSRYASQLVENDISIRSAQINSRAQIGISASTDTEIESARKYMDGLEAGKLEVIGKGAFLESISIANVSTQSANTIIQLIELQQYLKASWFNELGLNANFNMKREYLSRDEIATTTDILLPLVDDMLKCRKEAVAQINSIFGTNIEVEKSSAWANKNQEVLNSLASSAKEAGLDLPETILGEEGEDGDETPQADVSVDDAEDAPDAVQSTEQPDGAETGASAEEIGQAIEDVVKEVVEDVLQSEVEEKSDTE